MEDILSYRLSDLLLFSEHTFYRQFALYNTWLGPFHYSAYLYGALFLFVWPGKRTQLARALTLATAFLWLLCVYGFLHLLYVQINWMIGYLLPLMILQPVLLLWVSIRSFESTSSYAALTLWIAALIQPALELATGRPVEALSAYALTPDSLAVCSLALMFMLRQSVWFFVPAFLWLIFSTLTHFAMRDPMFWYLFFVLLVIAIAITINRYRGHDSVQ